MPLNEGLLAGDGFTVEGGQAVEMGSMGALAGAGGGEKTSHQHIDPATGEPHEDLDNIEWGAGLGRMILGQVPGLIFFGAGWVFLALPSYLFAGFDEEATDKCPSGNCLSVGNWPAFPLLAGLVGVLLMAAGYQALRIPLLAMGGPALRSEAVDLSWRGVLGFHVHSEGTQRTVEEWAMVSSTVGFVGAGWSFGLTTFCAYNKGHDLVFWEECYQVDRGFSCAFGNYDHCLEDDISTNKFDESTKLPHSYFILLMLAVSTAILGPLGWFALWKVVRQAVRPAHVKQKTAEGLKELPQTAMFALAAAVGCISGIGAWVFRMMIGAVHNILFMQKTVLSGEYDEVYNPDNNSWPYSIFYYDANAHTPEPYKFPQAAIILSPILGGLVVAFLVTNWAPEAKGHGVPEVMDAIHYKQGKIRPLVAGTKIVASSFSIGSGGSVGREGPIIQIGSTFGSMVGVASGCSIPQRITLIACGGAGGIAATFNTPIGGIVFAVELMLPAANSRTVMPLGITSVVATYIGRAILGLDPAFDVPDLAQPQQSVENMLAVLMFIPFGVVVGLVSAVFVKAIYWGEDFFEWMPGNYYSRHSLGMLGQGIIIYLMMIYADHYYVQGVGYATIKDILSWKAHSSHHLTSEETVNATAHSVDTSGIDGVDDGIGNPPFCMLLFVVKFISVNMTIGSGASGGIFSPSLFIGATLGGLWGHIVSIIVSAQASYDPIQAVVAGMAGMVAGTTGASLTAITMTFEMSRDYAAILPIIITSVLSHMTRKAISEDSIYTLKLVRRGHVVPEGLQAAVHAAQRVKDVMTSEFRVITKQEPMTQYEGITLLVAEEDAAPGSQTGSIGAVCGPVKVDFQSVFGQDMPADRFSMVSGQAEGETCVVAPDDDLYDAIRKMKAKGAEVLVVSEDPDSLGVVGVVGVVTNAAISSNLSDKSQLYSRDRTLRKDKGLKSPLASPRASSAPTAAAEDPWGVAPP